jgi:hypothetical protein
MLNLISTIFGFVSLIIALIGLIPLLGWLNWIALFTSLLGLFFGLIAERKTGQNLNLVVLILALIRLFIGGGII